MEQAPLPVKTLSYDSSGGGSWRAVVLIAGWAGVISGAAQVIALLIKLSYRAGDWSAIWKYGSFGDFTLVSLHCVVAFSSYGCVRLSSLARQIFLCSASLSIAAELAFLALNHTPMFDMSITYVVFKTAILTQQVLPTAMSLALMTLPGVKYLFR